LCCITESRRIQLDGVSKIDVKLLEELGVESHDIMLRFQTVRPVGLLLSLVCLSSDFIELSLELGRLKLLVRLGDREKSLLLGRELNDGLWHLVRVGRRGNVIRLQVDDMPPISGEILTRQWVMWPNRLLLSSLTNPFHGQMEQIFINSLNIIEFLSMNFNVKLVKENLVVHGPVSFKSKHTYVGLPQIRAYAGTMIYLLFKTNEPDGIIFYNGGNKNDFVALEINKGAIHWYFGLQNVIATNTTYNDNRWHSIVIKFDHQYDNYIAIDGIKFNTSNQKQQFIHLNGVLYVGQFKS